MIGAPRETRYRAIWISDIHLGTRGCKAEYLLDFLRWNDADTIYLVGDIVDGWRLRKSWYWPQTHNDVVQKLLRKVRKGGRVVYIPGNHDEWMRDYTELRFGGVEVVDDAVHLTADGKRLLVLHGDRYDTIVKHARWLALLGDGAYTFGLWVNHHLNKARRAFGYDYWSLSAYLKLRVKNAVQYMGSFAEALTAEAVRRGLDGVVCGHIHHAEIRMVGGLLYCNDGDWVESCTALVEHDDGRLEIIRWATQRLVDPMAPNGSVSVEPEFDDERPEPAEPEFVSAPR
ncbi:MAG: UDP-2,3-diacylglucosamine diphosphatase [Alphaproteobacteria bacterium]|nr:UDP-2,3-diacylglucosamine diphosphatase [Alphaproteobacteria bacterium]